MLPFSSFRAFSLRGLALVAAFTLPLAGTLSPSSAARAETPVAESPAAGSFSSGSSATPPAHEEIRLLKPFEPVEIVTRNGVITLEMEVARRSEDLMRGLMFRTSLPERHGMLFDFGFDQPISMWMKNTYIPLDMLFIRSDGTIVRIEEMTTPHSTRSIHSGEPARGVIELAGGAAGRLGIAPGDKVAHPIFSRQ